MTKEKEEAIEVIKAYKDNLTNSVSNQLDGDIKAFEMAISALEHTWRGKAVKMMYCEDAVSRQAVLDIDFKKIILTTAKPAEMIEQRVKALPPVTRQPDCRDCAKWKECECGEKGHKNGTSQGYSIGECNDFKRQTGKWILDETDNSITCDKCGCLIWANDICNGDAYYCPNCGAKMRGAV